MKYGCEGGSNFIRVRFPLEAYHEWKFDRNLAERVSVLEMIENNLQKKSIETFQEVPKGSETEEAQDLYWENVLAHFKAKDMVTYQDVAAKEAEARRAPKEDFEESEMWHKTFSPDWGRKSGRDSRNKRDSRDSSK